MMDNFTVFGLTLFAIIIIILVIWMVWVLLMGMGKMTIKKLDRDPFSLSIGICQRFRKNLRVLFDITYCGMPNERVFSLTFSHSNRMIGHITNLYFPISMERITLHDMNYTVLEVTPERITMRFSE